MRLGDLGGSGEVFLFFIFYIVLYGLVKKKNFYKENVCNNLLID